MAAVPPMLTRELPATNMLAQPPSLTYAHPQVRAMLAIMVESWGKGTPISAEEILALHPDLQEDRDVVLRIITEEMCLRQELHQEVATEDYVRRFPQFKEAIEALAEGQKLLDREVSLELAGAESIKLRDFQILTLLGQGGMGRVYLATQPFLGDRPVILKITPCQGSEHLRLARLQHTHIVPLYWVQDYPEKQQRVLCMPYFGSVTLAHLLAALKPVPVEQRTGAQILHVLDQAERLLLPVMPAAGPARQLLAKTSFAQAIAWMGSCLAEALHYAHERGLIHLDVKTSNVLWTTEGQPMLLDFHLARHSFGPQSGKQHGLGGTPGCMSPEQQAALKASCAGKPILHAVDARSDIFSLGLLLYRALGGPPEHLASFTRLHTINRQVSRGLADIIACCLHSNPEQRYASANLLANDLRRHLSELPLRGVPNRSWPERWGKWNRRHPHLRWTLFMILLLLTGSVLTGGWIWSHQQALQQQQDLRTEAHNRRLHEAEDLLVRSKLLIQDQKYDLALGSLQTALARLPDTLQAEPLARELKNQRRTTELLLHLRAAVDNLRQIAVVETISSDQRQDLDRKCRFLWEQQEHYQSAADQDPLLRQDVIELVLIWSDLVPNQANFSALQEVQKRWGPNQTVQKVLSRRGRFGWDTSLASPTSSSAWEEIAFARSLLLTSFALDPLRVTSTWGTLSSAQLTWSWMADLWQEAEPQRLLAAEQHLRHALKKDPKNEWGYYYQGICAYRRRQLDTAVQAFSICIALTPQRASAYYHRGLAHTQLGHLDLALEDYSQALSLDPYFANATLNRALVHAQRANYPAALADLENARLQGIDSERIRINRLLIEKLQHPNK